MKRFSSLADPFNKASAIGKLTNNTKKWFGDAVNGWSTIGDLGTGEYETVKAYVDALKDYWNVLSDDERKALFDEDTIKGWKNIIDYGEAVLANPEIYKN